MEDVTDSRRGFFIHDQLVAVLRIFAVAIGRTCADIIAGFHALAGLRPDFAADVGGVCLVYHVFERQDNMLPAVLVCFTVILVIDGDKTYLPDRKIFLDIVAGVYRASPQSG